MGSRENTLFDLNEPAVEDEETGSTFSIQPQRAVASNLLTTSSSPLRIVNSNVFSHVSSVSGFKPSIHSKGDQASEGGEDRKRGSEVVEKEEGEWSDAEGSTDANRSSSVPEMSTSGYEDKSQVKAMTEIMDQRDSNMGANLNTTSNMDDQNENGSCGRNTEGDIAMDNQEDHALAPKRRETKGAEITQVLKPSTAPGKRSKMDQQKEAMLGKKRSRQTMFLNLEDVTPSRPIKKSGSIKIATPRRQNLQPPSTTGIVKELRPIPVSSECNGEKLFQQTVIKDAKEVDQSCNEGNSYLESSDTKSECGDGDMISGPITRSKRTNSGVGLVAEDKVPSDHRLSSSKQSVDSRQMKNPHVPMKKPPLISQIPVHPKACLKKLPSRKPSTVTTQYQDTSVERLLREVTNEKFWQHPGPRIAEGIPAASCGGRATSTRAC